MNAPEQNGENTEQTARKSRCGHNPDWPVSMPPCQSCLRMLIRFVQAGPFSRQRDCLGIVLNPSAIIQLFGAPWLIQSAKALIWPAERELPGGILLTPLVPVRERYSRLPAAFPGTTVAKVPA
jgi:hypothetical protein